MSKPSRRARRNTWAILLMSEVQKRPDDQRPAWASWLMLEM